MTRLVDRLEFYGSILKVNASVGAFLRFGWSGPAARASAPFPVAQRESDTTENRFRRYPLHDASSAEARRVGSSRMPTTRSPDYRYGQRKISLDGKRVIALVRRAHPSALEKG
jgi:hypothetical protein